jgi:hypothetical protein
MKINIIKYGKVLDSVNVKAIITDMNILPDARYSIQTVKVSSENDVKDLPVLDIIENLEEDENILYISKDVTKIIKPLTVGTMLL